ncbi:MAG: Rpn family recombination-promoting nuclease/putative transposase [Alistipes sp.]|nr:Rpn family recombination-promoting nuclease/putative transposase [Alistipes sp.]
MNNTNKKFEELDVIDDFLMNAVATDPEVGEDFCRTILSVLLQRNINKLRVEAQKTIPANVPGLRGIRMDVEIIEEITEEKREGSGPAMNIYDIEPHLQNDMNFAKHNRFYQAKIDSRLMKSGETDFSKLPDLYVLTITNFDVFGKDYMMYRVHNRCEELPELEYDDGLQFLYFYTGGTKGGNNEIKAMLRYLQKSTEESITSEATKKLHEYVSKVRVAPEVREEYMRFEELMEYAREQGREQGKELGKELGREEGRGQGKAQGKVEESRNILIDILEQYGKFPEELRKTIEEENDLEKLRSWIRLAAKSDSIEEFMSKCNIRDCMNVSE